MKEENQSKSTHIYVEAMDPELEFYIAAHGLEEVHRRYEVEFDERIEGDRKVERNLFSFDCIRN